MSIENNDDSIKLSSADIEKKKKLIDSHFTLNTGLNEDTINNWQAAMFFKPVKHYKEYFLASYPEFIDYIMEKSSSEKVKEFDQLVDEFNSKLEQIRENNDQAVVKSYLDKAVKLIRE